MAHTLRSRGRVELAATAALRGSRFIATAAPVDSEARARALLDEVRAEFADARHHCAAWRIADPAIDRALDAGEPSGSAGRPILAQLTGRDLVDVCVVVTRYFGGVKLGVGGLVRAYGGAAAAVLDQSVSVPHVVIDLVRLEYGYDDGPAVERTLTDHGVETVDVAYGVTIVRTVALGRGAGVDPLGTALSDATRGRVRLTGPSR